MILDLFKYFATIPKLDGVKSAFSMGRSDVDGYDSLLQEISKMEQHSRIPQINEFIFGASAEVVKTRMDQVKGTFLFVDFGKIVSRRDSNGSISDDFELSITIATKMGSSGDLVEAALIAQNTLYLLSQLQALMIADTKKYSFLEQISFSYERMPFDTKEYSSIGWSLFVNQKGYDLLGIKEKTKQY